MHSSADSQSVLSMSKPMKSRINSGQRLIIPNGNLGMNPKKFSADGIGKSSKIIHTKGVVGSGRKALDDITNKSTCRQEVPLRKQERAEKKIDIPCEGFLHDHDKCIDVLKVIMSDSFLDLILPGNDSLPKYGCHTSDQAKKEEDTPQCYLDNDEMFVHEDNWSKYFAKQHSPPCSPSPWDLPSPLFSWPFEEPNFVLTMNDETDS